MKSESHGGAFTQKYPDLVTMLYDSVKRYGPRPLWGSRQNGAWSWMTFSEFGKLVDQFRAGLASLGITRGDTVAIISNNRVEWAVGAYAAYSLGARYSPMYESQHAKEWQYILNDCGAKACLCSTRAIADKVGSLKAELPALEHVVCFEGTGPETYAGLLAAGAASPVPPVHPDGSEIAGFIYTSGTTGNPKGVLLSHSNLACNISAMQAVVPFVENDRSLSFLPWAHSFGQTVELHGLISVGCSAAIVDDVNKLIDYMSEVQPTILVAVPRIFNRIYDGVQKNMATKPPVIQSLFKAGMAAASKVRDGKPLSLGETVALPVARKLVFSKVVQKFGGRLKYAVSGGAALSREVAEFIDNLGIMVYEGYGLTETSPIATCNSPRGRKMGTVGRPVPGITVRLDHEQTGDPENGEIVVYGHNIMQGYHGLPKENDAVFVTGAAGERGFRTGDMGRIDDDGFLSITGRIKEQYKLENGKYVSPAPLEEKLTLSPFILQCMVHGVNKPFNMAVIVPDMAALEGWAKENGITASGRQALLAEPRVHALIKAELSKYGADFKGFERVEKFLFADEDFTTQNEMLTPKMSIKRRNVVKKYGERIEALYGT